MICCQESMEKPLKTIIVDDEPVARRDLKRRLQKAGGLKITAEARGGSEALSLIRKHKPDLVILDIQMPGMDGFDVLRALPPKALPFFVFLTVRDDYAINAFEAHGLDYLLKPISERRLAVALERVSRNRDRRHAAKHRQSLLGLVDQISRPSERGSTSQAQGRAKKKEAPRLAIRDGGQTTWIRQDEIEWVDAAGDYMCVHARGETHIMRTTMKTLEKELDPAILQRVHRSAIVNVSQVQRLLPHINGEFFLTLKCGHRLKLSRSYKDKLRFFSSLIAPVGGKSRDQRS
jgi:two-component system LytT family response regulator